MKKTVVMTRRLPPAVEERLFRDYHTVANMEDRLLDASALIEMCRQADGLLVTPTEQVTQAVIDSLPQTTRVIACFSVGYDHIDVEAARSRGIQVTNTPDVLTDATADIAILLLLAAARDVWRSEKILREGQWSGWMTTCDRAVDFSGKRLGIFGMGRIGQAVAKRARGFDLTIHYMKNRRLSPEEEQGAMYHERIETFLPCCDFLTIHAPLTPQTYRFFNRERLALLPPKAILVNTARGGLVDDEALIAALKTKRLAAAGLDVFEGEPFFHQGYLELDNVVLYPHIGSSTQETRNAMGFMALDNLDAVLSGKPPLTPVRW